MSCVDGPNSVRSHPTNADWSPEAEALLSLYKGDTPNAIAAAANSAHVLTRIKFARLQS
jgi:hypothetical protein